MKPGSKSSIVYAVLTAWFGGLTALFLLELWGRPVSVVPVPLVDSVFTNRAPVRLSAGELIRSGGDTSGFACYACHDEKKPVTIQFDSQNTIILPEEHNDLVMHHGRNNRNNYCFNCHNATNLEQLITRDGRILKLEESTLLCASCHGPTYRDWEAGIHGRTSGHWNRQAGRIQREDCASCHDPHASAFPTLKPAPAPHSLHPKKGYLNRPSNPH